MPAPESDTASLKVAVPPVRFWTETDRPPLFVMAHAQLIAPLPPLRSMSASRRGV